MPALVSSDSEPEDSLDDPRNSLDNLPANFRGALLQWVHPT